MTVRSDELVPLLDDVYRYAWSLTRDPDRAADIVQDTMVRAIDRRDQYRGDAPLLHWLMRIAYHLVLDASRRGWREIVVDDVEADWRDDDFSVDPEAVAARAATRLELEDALARLPFIYRSVVVLHDIEEHTVAHIADVLGIGLPAAKQRLRRGRMALVHALAEGHERRRATRGVPMRCWEARRHVSEYLNDDLDPPTRRLVESHLGGCPTCPPLYAALVGVHDELGRLRDSDRVVPPTVSAAIEERLSRPRR